MDLEKLFPTMLKPALGCTEPVSIALAVAAAVQAAAGWTPDQDRLPLADPDPADIESIRIEVNQNIFKNTFSIYIPNAGGHKGILMATAVGVFCDPRRQLEVFSTVGPQHVEYAQDLMQSGKISVEIAEGPLGTDLYIKATSRIRRGKEILEGVCLIRDYHTNIVMVQRNGEVVFQTADRPRISPVPDENLEELRGMSIAGIVAQVEHLPPAVKSLLRKAIAMNMKICEAGLAEPLGLGAGYHGIGDGEAGSDMSHQVSNLAAAGSDARMAGYPLEVMSLAGSGNQGIIATMPVVSYARGCGLAEERLLQAVALSHLVTMHITLFVGYLSALCGVAIKAGVGAACGITYAMGGDAEDVQRAVKIMAATLSGMICDGAKPGCALKVSSAADMATRAASLAIKKVEVSADDGIVAPTAEQTIRNLAELSRSMEIVDSTIIHIMNEKIR